MDFFPIHIILPSSTPEEYINQLATYIIDIMKITPSVIPSLGYDDKTKNALIKIAELLRRATKKNHYCSSSFNSNTYFTTYLPPCWISEGNSATSIASCTISVGSCIKTNTTSECAKVIQYTETMVIHTTSSEQFYSKN